MYTHQFDCAYRFSPDPFTVPELERRLQLDLPVVREDEAGAILWG
jgi:hypothetical protein